MELLPNKEYFKKYRSNTLASTSNNYMLIFDEEKTVTSRIYYKVRRSGKFNYRFLFSNIADSTFSNGSVSYANLEGDEFEIINAFAGDSEKVDNNLISQDSLTEVRFNSSTGKTVKKGEVYWSDETELDIKENHYLVFQWTVRGKRMAYTPDKIIPSFVQDESGNFVESRDFPQPHLIGCDADFEKNIAFIGDSITMGLGTSVDKYNFWVAHIGRGLGDKYSVWNLGLGFGRGQDAATDRIWLEKAKQYDIVSVCFGVNDILQGRSASQIKKDITTIIDALKKEGLTTCIFTVPAFDWEGANKAIWDEVNEYIVNVLAKRTDYWFDMASASGDPCDKYRSHYGGHPSDEGCAQIGKEFLKKYSSL